MISASLFLSTSIKMAYNRINDQHTYIEETEWEWIIALVLESCARYWVFLQYGPHFFSFFVFSFGVHYYQMQIEWMFLFLILWMKFSQSTIACSHSQEMITRFKYTYFHIYLFFGNDKKVPVDSVPSTIGKRVGSVLPIVRFRKCHFELRSKYEPTK